MRKFSSLLTLVLAGTFVLAGCGDSDADRTSDSLGSDEDYSVLRALGELPATALDDDALIHTADLSRASELGGLTRPDQDGDAAEWLSVLSGGTTKSGSTGVFVPLPGALGPGGNTAAQTTEEFGWSVLDVDAFASVESPPDDVTVISGEFTDDTLSGELTEIDGGVLTDRSAKDHEMDLGSPTALSRLGAPTRLAQRDGRIAFSASTAAVRGWLEDDRSSLAQQDSLASVARALDQDEVYSAVLTVPSTTSETSPEPEDSGVGEPFDAVGIGWHKKPDGDQEGAGVSVAYHFDSEATAASAQESLREHYESGTYGDSDKPLSEDFTLSSVRVTGPVVVVSVRPVEDASLARLFMALQSRDPLFSRS